MVIKEEKKRLVITVVRGQKIIEEITKQVSKRKIRSAFFIGIGAVSEVTLAHYNVETKKYSSLKFRKPLELTSLIGNIAFHKEKPIIHAHATLSDPKMKVIAGHLVEAKISGTCEIILFLFDRPIKKTYDPETGLKIMKES